MLNLRNLTPLAVERYEVLDKLLERRRPNIIKAYFPETDMRLSHDGLKVVAAEADVDLSALKVGEMVLFTNKEKTACKLYAGGDVILYQKAPKNMRLIYSAILALPRYFNGQKVDLASAIKDGVIHDHDQREWRKTGVVPERIAKGAGK